MQIESCLTLFDSRNPSAIRIFRACKGLTIPLITGTRPSARCLCHGMGAETRIAHAAGILDGASSCLLCAESEHVPARRACEVAANGQAGGEVRAGCHLQRTNSRNPDATSADPLLWNDARCSRPDETRYRTQPNVHPPRSLAARIRPA